MKKQAIYLASLLLVISITLFSCKKDDDTSGKKDEDTLVLKGKKIISLVNVGTDSSIFKYDNYGNLTKTIMYDRNQKLSFEQENKYLNNKLVSITSYTYDYYGVKEGYTKDSILYDNNRAIAFIYYTFYNGFHVVSTQTMTYNSDGLLSKITEDKNDNYTEYTYDTKGNVATSKNLIVDKTYTTTFQYDNKINPCKGNPYNFLSQSYLSNNNLISYSGGYTYEYKYDTEGYPIEKTLRSITITKYYYDK